MSDLHVERPLVSVIIPVYNAAKYLRETLDCVCRQTLRQIEIICVDDGSTDESLSILQEYAAQDGRVRILQQKNQYAGVARNNGMTVARGKYLSFLDADDLFEPDMLEKMHTKAMEVQGDIVICEADCFRDDIAQARKEEWLINETVVKKLPSGVFNPSEAIPHDILQLTAGVPWNKLFLKEFIDKNSLQWAKTQNANDFGFVFQTMALAKRVFFINEVFVHYRICANSISHKKSKNPEALLNALRDLYERLKPIPHFDTIKYSFYDNLLEQLIWHLSSSEPQVREQRAELYRKSYEPYFRLLQLSPDIFRDKTAYKKIVSVIAPELSIIVQEKNPKKLRKCIASFGGLNLGKNEIICSQPIELGEEEAEINRLLRSIPGIRMLRHPVNRLTDYARGKQVLFVPEGRMLDTAVGDIYDKLPITENGLRDLAPYLVPINKHDFFYQCSPDKKSYRLFGKGIFSIQYTERVVSYWVLGHLLFNRLRQMPRS